MPVTKENFFDFRRSENEYEPVYIDGTAVEVCDKYNYLGMFIDRKLSFFDNADYLYKRSLEKLYYVRATAKLQVDKDLVMFFHCVIVPSLVNGCVVYYGFLTGLRNQENFVVRF